MHPVLAAIVQDKVLPGFRAPLITGIIALVVSWALTPWIRKLAIKKGVLADPKADDRRVHTEPTPLWGGIAIFGGILVAILIAMPVFYGQSASGPFPVYLVGLLLCAAAVVVMGALDDLYQYKAKVQAIFLLAIGVIVQLFVTKVDAQHPIAVQIAGINLNHNWIAFGWAALPVTAIYLFVVTKTMDTIDGLDGLAAGISAITATTLSIVATYFVLNHPSIEKSAYQELPRVALISAAIAGASLGFLRHNYNPAKIFMGTSGSQVLGFMLAAISIVGVLKTAVAVSLVIPILAFGVPIFDAIQVIIKRIRAGQPITQGDKRHLHHTLLKKGLSQKQAVLVLYLAAIVLCGIVLVLVRIHV